MKKIIQNKTMLKLSGLFILIIILMLGLWKYEINQYLRIHREFKQATAKLENYRDCLQNAEFYTQQCCQIQKTISQFEARCYQNKTPSLSTTCLLEDIQKIIDDKRDSIVRIDVLPEKEMGAGYVQIGINLKLKTSAQGLTDILYKLKTSAKSYQVNGLSVQVSSDGLLDVEMKMNAIHRG
ncbi:hypothetical protein AUJ95_02860 [Candidatus Desantisbacteria bacterium CG2_30_40_21]|uniref:Uncharacterized protein n=2 Tax=unclassified Candidatus Desantisiibacteriota TaxID=3106372 RepID=A0A2M7P2N7_9BACT|nr:MAG: hypothetical protein AUJ95_02860 [Candidatus Desantisbacteria bacterium CG2_30_40_21]PIY19867.1 MAG: hypothetical protein COZ13_03090 [Candidatus Desantisbacteria bacterium CG_4_10_14_3_um_filter_40_18]